MTPDLSPSARLTMEAVREATRQIDPVFLNTPQFISEPLGDLLGVRLTVKIETLNPIRSFKGRGADLLASGMAPQTRIFCASAGNFGQAMAYACRKRKIPITVFASRSANPLKLERMRTLQAEVVIAGSDFDDAKTIARRAALESGARFIEDSQDVETVLGPATIGLELARFPEPPDAMLISLGNGSLFNGVGFALKSLRPATRMIAVQSRGAPAMIESWRSGALQIHPTCDTIADGLAVRIPIPVAVEEMRQVADDALLVEDRSLIEAMRLVHRHTGLVVEPSAVAGLAALLESRGRFRGQQVGLILCGGNMTETQMKDWLG